MRWLSLQIAKLGVDVRTGATATPESLADLSPDAIVLASGATYSRLGVSKNQLVPIKGADLAHVLTPEDILTDHARLGQRIVVYDNTAYEVGPGIAELLADAGKDITLITMDAGMAMSVSEIGVNKLLSSRLMPKVTFLPNTRINSIDPENVVVENIYTHDTVTLEEIDNTILVTSKPPQDDLYHALVGKVPELHLIGDARVSRWSVFATDEAIKDGRRVGLLL